MKNIIKILFFLLITNINAQVGYYPYSKTENHQEKWGIINSKKEIILNPSFEYEISFFYNHETKYPVAKFRKSRREYGLINHKGKVIIKPIYNVIYPSLNEKIIFLKKDELLSIYNVKIKKA